MGELFITNQTGGESGDNIISIEDAIITLAGNENYVYDGTEKTRHIASVVIQEQTLVEGRDYVVIGNKGVNAGTYTISIFGIMDYSGIASIDWSIAKKQSSLTVENNTVSIIGPANTTKIVNITSEGDGIISVESSNTSIAVATINGNEITITSVAAGNATITVTISSGNNYSSNSSTINATVTLVSEILSENTPEIIQIVAQARIGSNFWSVGDKTAVINFQNVTVGALSFSGLSACAFIIGFDHNLEGEEPGIHFQFGKTEDGKDIAWCDSNYQNSGSTSSFRMNTSSTNSGGWNESYMRNTICPAFLNALPIEWKNVIDDTTKYTDNRGRGNENSDAAGEANAFYISSTLDKIFLLSEFEMLGERHGANMYEEYFQEQYAYYVNGNHVLKYKHNNTTAVCFWWTRSVYAFNSTSFVAIYGNSREPDASTSFGFAPAFRIG